MEPTYEKLDENTLKVVKTETKSVEQTYDYSFLKEQLAKIQAQKDADNALRDAEISEVEALVSEADRLQIKDKVIEEELAESTEM